MIEPETTRQKQPVARASWGWTYLMCPPDRYDVVYSINPWMNTAIPVDRGRAREQWDALAAALEAAGAQVRTVEPRAGVPDMVFTANAGLVLGDAFVPATMRHPERQGERPYFESWFREHGYRIDPLPLDAVQEGAGRRASVRRPARGWLPHAVEPRRVPGARPPGGCPDRRGGAARPALLPRGPGVLPAR